jgi:hypothetical protein
MISRPEGSWDSDLSQQPLEQLAVSYCFELRLVAFRASIRFHGKISSAFPSEPGRMLGLLRTGRRVDNRPHYGFYLSKVCDSNLTWISAFAITSLWYRDRVPFFSRRRFGCGSSIQSTVDCHC